ncbi:MAG: archaetidylserine decarboxylase, partial [Gammaproteobacteria bacterium]
MSHLFVLIQYLLPQQLLSRLTGRLAAGGFAKNLLIRWFIKRYQVDMTEAACEEASAYQSFNDFFTRALKPGARPIDCSSGAIVSPADGAISQFGYIDGDQLYQAKGREFSLQALLAGDDLQSARYVGGSFMTVYLSPRDYHRVHLPLAGKLLRGCYVPGKLFSVNGVTTAAVPGLFARNERYIMEFETAAGYLSVIMVGAMIVAGIETVWGGQVCPLPGRRQITVQDYAAHSPPIELATGAEIGRFKLGSTVIMLFQHGAMSFAE